MVGNVIALYRRAYEGLPNEVWMLSVAAFINRFGTMVLPFLTLYLTSELGYQEAAAGRMLSAYGLGSILGAYAGGRLTAALGAIRLQIVFLLLAVPMFLVIPLIDTGWGIALALFLLSFFADGIRPASATAITQFTPPELQVRAFGLQRMALNLGISFGPAIGGVLATVGFVWLFVADAATTLLCALALIYFFGRGGDARWKLAGERPGAEAHGTGSPIKDRWAMTFLALVLLASTVFFQFHVTYPLFLRDHYGLTKPMIGLMYAVNTVVIVAFEMLLLDYVRGRPPIPVIGCGALLSCVGFGILPFGSSAAYGVFSMLVITLGEMLWMPLASGWIAERSQRGSRGMYMGWYMMTFSTGAVTAPALGGAVYQYSRPLVWYLSLGIGAAVLAGFVWLHRVLRREEAEARWGMAAK